MERIQAYTNSTETKFTQSIFGFVAAALTLLIAMVPAHAADRFMTLDEAGAGSLMLRTDRPGQFVQAPLVSSDIKVSVTGPVSRVIVTQRFVNPSNRWVEAVYVFPLPQDAAVDTLRMRIGDRFVAGKIEERKKARRDYEAAKAQGKRAALVEQNRPNVFTNTVANIGPGETIVAQIEYQQALAPKDGRFSLRVPLVVAPRFTPKPTVFAVNFGEAGWSLDQNGPPVEPPMADPRDQDPGAITNPVTLRVDLAAGFDIGHLDSPFHDVTVTRAGLRRASVSLTGPVSADRDFELIWAPAKGDAPQAALLTETQNGSDHLILMLTPPEIAQMGEIKPREVIFVQDVSGSMGGTSIQQARKGLELALRSLRPQDRFNIVTFNNTYQVYAPQALQATPEAIEEAVHSVRRLQASGGTNMLPALHWALQDRAASDGVLRQVIFLTDGAVNNEAELFAMIGSNLGRSRLFTVGIGSAPNSHFMVKAAEHGRGAHVYIGNVAEVERKMADLFAKIETPALTDIALELPRDLPGGLRGRLQDRKVDGETQTYPDRIPDLYTGDPIVIAVRTSQAKGVARLRGNAASGPFEIEIPLDQAARRPGVAKLWARKRIAGLEAERVSRAARRNAAGDLDKAILRTALEYQITSRLTSLIAVDTQIARPQDETATQTQIALALPQGWDPAAFLGERPEIDDIQRLDPGTEARLFKIKAPVPPATDADRVASAGSDANDAKVLGGADAAQARLALAAPAQQGAMVPKGATNWQLWLLLGGILTLAGALLAWFGLGVGRSAQTGRAA